MSFCRELTRRAREAGINLPEGYEFTLPTEAQWEYAARGGHRMSGYNVYSGGNSLDAVGWYYENSGRSRLNDSSWSGDRLDSNGNCTHPVGTKAANELGIHDMSGNVWELCRDSCNSSGGVVTDTYVNDITDPYCRSGSRRVDRGGSRYDIARGCRVAYRSSCAPSFRSIDLGFRVALAPVQ